MIITQKTCMNATSYYEKLLKLLKKENFLTNQIGWLITTKTGLCRGQNPIFLYWQNLICQKIAICNYFAYLLLQTFAIFQILKSWNHNLFLRRLIFLQMISNYPISANSFRKNYSFLNLALCTVTFRDST